MCARGHLPPSRPEERFCPPPGNPRPGSDQPALLGPVGRTTSSGVPSGTRTWGSRTSTTGTEGCEDQTPRPLCCPSSSVVVLLRHPRRRWSCPPSKGVVSGPTSCPKVSPLAGGNDKALGGWHPDKGTPGVSL